jgi:hypothetical protein
MWRKTLIGTMALALAAGGAASALAQDNKDDAAKRGKDEAAGQADVAKAEADAARAKLEAEVARLRDEERKQAELNARDAVKEKAKAIGEERLRVLAERQQKIAELQALKAQEAAVAAQRAAQDRAAAADWVINQNVREKFVDGNQIATKKVKIAFCGVGTSEAPAVLCDHLRITPGMGLVVDYVEPKSPAEQSGLKQYDVLVKFDDQKLVNSDQLRALVRLRKPGDDVKMTIFRQGQSKEMVVELGEKEVDEPVQVGMAGAAGLDFPVIHLNLAADGGDIGPRVIAPVGGQAIALTNVNGKDQAVWSDGTHRLTIDMKGGKPINLTVRPQDGNADAKPLFEGAIETDEQRKAVPAEYRAKLETALAAIPAPMPGGGMPRPQPRAGAAPGAGMAPGVVPPAGNRLTVRRVDPAGGGGDIVLLENGNMVGGDGRLFVAGGTAAGGRGNRVVTSTEKDNLLIARIEGGKVTQALIFSQADGKTVFEGPVRTPEQRKAMPEAALKQLEVLEKNQNIAPEFGVVGRN